MLLGKDSFYLRNDRASNGFFLSYLLYIFDHRTRYSYPNVTFVRRKQAKFLPKVVDFSRKADYFSPQLHHFSLYTLHDSPTLRGKRHKDLRFTRALRAYIMSE